MECREGKKKDLKKIEMKHLVRSMASVKIKIKKIKRQRTSTNKTWSSSKDLDATLGGMVGRAFAGVGATAAILENNSAFFSFFSFGDPAQIGETRAKRPPKKKVKKINSEKKEKMSKIFFPAFVEREATIVDTLSVVPRPHLCLLAFALHFARDHF